MVQLVFLKNRQGVYIRTQGYGFHLLICLSHGPGNSCPRHPAAFQSHFAQLVFDVPGCLVFLEGKLGVLMQVPSDIPDFFIMLVGQLQDVLFNIHKVLFCRVNQDKIVQQDINSSTNIRKKTIAALTRALKILLPPLMYFC
jgi:hypothetical protein